MLNTAVEAAIDVATTSFDPMAKLAKDIAAGAVLIATGVAVAVGYLVFSGQVATRELEAARPADRRVGGADARRARADDDRRDRDEGAHRPRDAAPRRPSVRPRRGRVRGLDGGDAAPRRLGPSLPDLVADLHHGVARGSDPRRIRSALDRRGRLRRPARRARDARGLPGRRNERGARRQGGGRGREGVRAVLELHRRRGRPHARRARVRGRQRRERGVSARRLRREERARRRGRRRLRPGRDRGDRDHRLAVRRLPPVAARVQDPARSASGAPTARSRRTRPTSCCRTPGTSRTREVRVRRRRGPAERRQVDARERARRREDRDHLDGAEHDPPPDLRRRERRGLPARPRRPARLPAPDGQADQADAEHGRLLVRGHRRRALRPLRARPDRRRRPLHRAAGVRARQAGDHRRQQGRQPEAGPHHQPDEGGRAARRLPRAPPGEREDEGRDRRAARTTSSTCCRRASRSSSASRPPTRRARSGSRS